MCGCVIAVSLFTSLGDITHYVVVLDGGIITSHPTVFISIMTQKKSRYTGSELTTLVKLIDTLTLERVRLGIPHLVL